MSAYGPDDSYFETLVMRDVRTRTFISVFVPFPRTRSQYGTVVYRRLSLFVLLCTGKKVGHASLEPWFSHNNSRMLPCKSRVCRHALTGSHLESLILLASSFYKKEPKFLEFRITTFTSTCTSASTTTEPDPQHNIDDNNTTTTPTTNLPLDTTSNTEPL